MKRRGEGGGGKKKKKKRARYGQVSISFFLEFRGKKRRRACGRGRKKGMVRR